MTLGFSFWLIWGVLALLLLILELLTSGFLLGCFGMAALLSALTAAVGLSLAWQLLFFAAGSLITLYLLRPMLLKLQGGKPDTRTGMDALLGKTARVVEAINNQEGKGYVMIDGDTWRAISLDDEPIAKGRTVLIVRYESIVVYVRAVD